MTVTTTINLDTETCPIFGELEPLSESPVSSADFDPSPYGQIHLHSISSEAGAIPTFEACSAKASAIISFPFTHFSPDASPAFTALASTTSIESLALLCKALASFRLAFAAGILRRDVMLQVQEHAESQFGTTITTAAFDLIEALHDELLAFRRHHASSLTPTPVTIIPDEPATEDGTIVREITREEFYALIRGLTS